MDNRESKVDGTLKENYLITKRPEGMSYEAYKIIRAQQNKALNKYKKGILVKRPK